MHRSTVNGLAICLSLSCLSSQGGPATFKVGPGSSSQAWFCSSTMRIDLYHVGTRTKEQFAIADVRAEGAWPGSYSSLLHDRKLGDYRISVYGGASNKLLFIDGFDSTLEADEHNGWAGTIETVRIPYPVKPVVVVIRKELATNGPVVWTGSIDPSSPSVDQARLSLRPEVKVIFENGAPQHKVDLAILGDGYTAAESSKFWADAKRASDYLFSVSPYKENAASFNVRSIYLPSEDGGISSPLDNTWRRSVFRSTYNAHGVERSIGVQDLVSLRDAAAVAPYDAIIVLANSKRYGGSARFNDAAVIAIDSAWSKYLVVHEFGHTFAGLGDEYYTLADCRRTGQRDPWYPNVSASRSRTSLKWRDLVAKEIPIPTPWLKARYDKFDQDFARKYFALRKEKATEDEVDRLIRDALPQATAMLEDERYHGKVGAFEGAEGEACGLYRPELNCTMFTLTSDHFCAVCARAIKDAISYYVR
jgi:IgA peptidase M64/peptidase M64-like protein